MELENLSSKQKLLIFALITTFIFALPQILRTTFYHDSMVGSTTYYHRRISNLITSGANTDPLSFGGRPMTYPPGFSWMIDLVPAAEFILAPIIGGLGIVICYYFVKELGFNDRKALYSSIFLFFNPAYAYFSIHLNPRLPAIVLMILSYLMINKDNRIINYLSVIPVAISLYTSPLIGVSLILIGIAIFRKRLKKLALPFSVAFLSFLAYFLPIINKYGLFQRYEAYNMFVEFNKGIQYFVIESGLTAISFTIIMVIMASYGFFKLRGESIEPIREWIFIGFLASMIIFSRMNDLLIFPVSIMTGIVFASKFEELKRAFRIEWVSTKKLKVIVMLYLLVILAIPGINMITTPPKPEQYQTMNWIKNNTPENATIMAYWWEGHYITGIAKRKNVMDAYLEFAPKVDERYNDIQRAMETSRANETIEIMKKYNSSYLLYKLGEMEGCSGFPYVSKDPRFKEIYSNGDYRLYELHEQPVSPGSDLCEEVTSKGED